MIFRFQDLRIINIAVIQSESIIKMFEDYTEDLKKAFQVYDSDNDGEINQQELGKVMRGLGINCSQIELEEIITESDAEGKQTIDFNSFMRLMKLRFKETNYENELQAVFNQFDADGDGQLSFKEFKDARKFTTLSEEETEEVFRNIDKDEKGCISYKQFEAFIHDSSQ